MPPNHPLKLPLVITVVAAFIFFAIVVFILFLDLMKENAYPKSAPLNSTQAQENSLPIQQAESLKNVYQGPASSKLRSRLIIPWISVNTALEFVGLTPDGAVGVPQDPANAALFSHGPRPGEKGSALVVGHFGWKNGVPTVFDDLNQLRKGDQVFIDDGHGDVIKFAVRELKIYGPNDDAREVFHADDEEIHLNLISCYGIWDEVLKSYPSRLVVFTDKVE
jgi:LPXTG-site transpeptidase (sortase) family protein